MQAQGLFSGVNPDLVAQQEQLARQKTNLDLAQASNPFASTMFAGLNMADQFKNQVADVFGNPLEESAAVKAAKEEKALEQEVAAMVMQGRQQGKDNATIAQEVQQFLMSRGKFQKAEQARTQQLSEEQTGAKVAAEVGAKQASAAKDNAQAAEAQAKALFMQTSLEARKKGIKARFPNLSDDIINAAAQDEKVLADMLKGSPPIETAEGVVQLQPDGTYKRIGSAVDKRTTVTMQEFGGKEYVKGATPVLIETQNQLEQLPIKIAELDKQIAAVNNNPMILGAQAENRVAIANAFQTLGLSTPDNIEKLSNTKAFIAAQKRLVLQDLGGKLGAAISTSDREFIEAQFGQLQDSPQALGKILGRIKQMYTEQGKQLRVKEARLLQSVRTGVPSAVGEEEIPKPQPPSKVGGKVPTTTILNDQEFINSLSPEDRARLPKAQR